MDGGVVNTVAVEGGSCGGWLPSVMEAIEQVLCELKQLAFTGSALPEIVLLLIENVVVAKVSHEVASYYVLK